MITSPTTIGVSVPRRDLRDKLTGAAMYAADMQIAGMLTGAVLRSPHPHARILSVDVSDALALAGVYAALTPFDAPEGSIAPDMPILDTEVRFVGDEVAAVAADDEHTARHALSLVRAEYETLPFVTDAQEAIKPDAPPVHSGGNLVGGEPLILERGSVEEGFAEADVIVEDTFSTPAHHGAALEPRVAVASWDGDELTVWKSSRGVHQDRLLLSIALGVPRERIRVIGLNMGAGYGNKDETRLSALAAILAQRAGRPVKPRIQPRGGVRGGQTPTRYGYDAADGRESRRGDYRRPRHYGHGYGRVPVVRSGRHTARGAGRAVPVSLREREIRRLSGVHQHAVRRVVPRAGRSARAFRAGTDSGQGSQSRRHGSGGVSHQEPRGHRGAAGRAHDTREPKSWIRSRWKEASRSPAMDFGSA